MLEALKEEVFRLHLELPRSNLVVWTSGNVSARDTGSGLVVIKPSGVKYEVMQAADMVVVDLDGKVVEGELKPSSDTASHLYIYRHMENVNGVVHTHSNYATAFAALGKPIPVYLTAIGEAVAEAMHFLADNGYDGEARRIDISGDGRSNAGREPAMMRNLATAAGITINGLAILTEAIYVPAPNRKRTLHPNWSARTPGW